MAFVGAEKFSDFYITLHYDGWCLELRRLRRQEEEGESGHDLLKSRRVFKTSSDDIQTGK